MNEIKSYLFIITVAIKFSEGLFYPLGYYGSQLLSYPLTAQYNNPQNLRMNYQIKYYKNYKKTDI